MTHDVLIIGGGSAGYAAARTARDEGANVGIIDQGPLGGLCILRGCMPTKTILRSSDVASLLRRAEEFGLYPVAAKVNLSAIIDRKARLIGEFTDDRIQSLKDTRFTLYQERAAFRSPEEVQAGPHRLTAKAIIISTGSAITRMPIPGLEEVGYITSSSPAIVVNGVIVVGNSAEQGYNQSRQEMVPGDILAFDARTGAFKWKFDVLPGPGEFGHDTWENDAWRWTGDISSWAPLSADPELGIVYIPTNGATADFWGGFRPGDNLFSTSLIALDVQTGERVWHYQLVHHDIWNYDTPQVPLLMDVTVDGEDIPAVIQVTKQAFVYAFNRKTGEPIWPIEEKPVPAAYMPGEKLSETQPHPTRPAPYELQGLTEDDLIDFTPELRLAAIEALESYQIGPLFNPPLHRDYDIGKTSSLWCPGDVGGTNIDGTPAADPTTGILYVTSQKGCSSRIMIPGHERDAREERPTGKVINDFAVGSSRGTPRVHGLPIFKPPYSRITAIDMNTGEHLWWIPVGDTPDRVLNSAFVKGVDIPNTGTGRQAAQIVTATLLIHTGNGSDGTPFLYAVDKATGERLVKVELPGNPRYGIITYMHEGKQYFVVQAANMLMALRLP